MKVSLYTFVGVFSRALDTLAHVLNKGAEFAKAQGVPEAEMLEWRLAPDMFPLRRQAHIVIDFSRQWLARAAGVDVPAGFEGETTLAEIQAAIADAKAYVNSFKPEQFEGRDEVPLTVNIGVMEPTFPVSQWVPGFALVNLMFHLSMAYGILRHKGVELGKRDLFAGGL